MASGGKKSTMLLADARPGLSYKIEAINGGYGLNSRLNAMGIIPGETIKIIHHTRRGPITLAVKGVRLALGRGVSYKIEVSQL